MDIPARSRLFALSPHIPSRYLALFAVVTAVFVWDLLIPLGVTVSILYIAAVLISLWLPRNGAIYASALLCSILSFVAIFLKPGQAELWKVLFSRTLAVSALWVSAILGVKLKLANTKRERALRERERVMEDVRILRGLLPICSSCKKIRNGQGYWTQIEAYIRDNSEADFSHGICPECAQKLYPDITQK